MNPGLLLLGGGALLAIVLLAVVVLGSRSRGDVAERLDRFAARGNEAAAEARPRARGRGSSVLAAQLDRAIAGRGFAARISRDLAQANMKLTVAEFLALRMISVIAGLGIGYLVAVLREGLSPILTSLIGAILGFFAPSLMVRRAKGRRLRAFNNQLGDTITLLANSLRSGYSLLQSMEMVARESTPPVSEEFHRVVQEVGLGLSVQDALANLYRRVPSDDLDLMITAINIQHEVGGNLAQILDTIGHTIRERVRIKGEIRVLVAQQRISGYVVAALPIFLALILVFIAPTYMDKLFNPIGLPPFLGGNSWICMPICSLILMLAGFLVIQRIVNIEV
ncbi:MAG: type II secretion system F family protein [Chloroflexia bacterium]